MNVFPATESSRSHTLTDTSAAQPQTPAGGQDGSAQPWSSMAFSTNSSVPTLLSPPKHLYHCNRLQKVTLRCKASAKRKVTVTSYTVGSGSTS